MKVNFVNLLKLIVLFVAIVLVTSSCKNVKNDDSNENVEVPMLNSMKSTWGSKFTPEYHFVNILDTNCNVLDVNGNMIVAGLYIRDKFNRYEYLNQDSISVRIIDSIMNTNKVKAQWYLENKLLISPNETVKAKICMTNIPFQVHRKIDIEFY